MSEPQLGKLIGDKEVYRDAIHVAVVPLIAGENIYKGDKFRLASSNTETAYSAEYNNKGAIGIVDPFLNEHKVEKGKRFWGFLFPGTVTGMRHHWFHPAFVEETPSIPAFNDREYEYSEAYFCCQGDESPEDHWEQEEAEFSYRWIQDFCDRWNFDIVELIANATSDNKEEFSRYIVAKGKELHSSNELGEDHNLFWKHLETYTGEEYNKDHREGMGWSCSC